MSRTKNSDLGLHRKRSGGYFRRARPSPVRKLHDMTREERGLATTVCGVTLTFPSRYCLVEMLEFFENYPKNRRVFRQKDLPVKLFKPKNRERVIKALYELLKVAV